MCITIKNRTTNPCAHKNRKPNRTNITNTHRYGHTLNAPLVERTQATLSIQHQLSALVCVFLTKQKLTFFRCSQFLFASSQKIRRANGEQVFHEILWMCFVNCRCRSVCCSSFFFNFFCFRIFFESFFYFCFCNFCSKAPVRVLVSHSA